MHITPQVSTVYGDGGMVHSNHGTQCTSLHRSLLCMVMEGWCTQIMGHNAHHSTGLYCVWWWRDGALKSWDTMHITPQVSTVYGDGGMVHSNHGTQCTSLHRSLLCMVMEGWCTQIMGHNAHHSTGLYCVWWWRDGALKSWDTMHITPQVSTVYGDGGMVHSNHGTQCTSLHRSPLCVVMEAWCSQIMGHNAHHSTGLYCVWWWRDGTLKSWDTMHITPQVSTVCGDGGMVHSNHGTQCTSLHRSPLCMVMEAWCTQIMGHNVHHSTGLYSVWWWRDGALKSWDTMHITPQVSTVCGDGGMVHSNHGTQCTSLHRSLLCMVMEGWCTQIMGHNAHHSTGLYCVWWWRDGALKSWDTMHITPQVSTVYGDGGMVHSNHGTQCTSLHRSLLCVVMEGWCTQIMGHNAHHSTGLYCVWWWRDGTLKSWDTMHITPQVSTVCGDGGMVHSNHGTQCTSLHRSLLCVVMEGWCTQIMGHNAHHSTGLYCVWWWRDGTLKSWDTMHITPQVSTVCGDGGMVHSNHGTQCTSLHRSLLCLVMEAWCNQIMDTDLKGDKHPTQLDINWLRIAEVYVVPGLELGVFVCKIRVTGILRRTLCPTTQALPLYFLICPIIRAMATD